MKPTCFWLRVLISAGLVGALAPMAARADVMPITAVTIADHPTLVTGELLTSVTSDGTTYANLIGGTAANVSGGTSLFYSSAEATTDKATLLSGLSTTTGLANVTSVDITFGTQVFSLGDDSSFFMFDIYGNDSASVQLLDSGGNPIADYSLTTGSGYGVSVDPGDAVLVNGGGEEAGYYIKGLSFALEDFTYTGTGTDPGMPDVYGLRFTGSGWDPALLGATLVPEPPSVLLLLMATGALGLAVRWYR